MDKPKINPIMSSAAPRGAKQNLNYQPGQAGQNLQNLAGTINSISQELQRQEARSEQLKMQNFEEQLDNQYKALQNRLAQSQDPTQFDAEVSSALEQMKATGQEYLGERLFKRWERDFGANYYDALKNDTDAKKINLLSRINFQTAQDTVRQKAYDYAYAAPEVQHELDRDFESYLELSGFTPLQKQELAGQYDKDKTVSRLHWLFDADPAQIAYKDKNGKIVSPMDDKNQYTNLTVEEKLSWKNRALRWQEAQEEAAKKETDKLKSQNHQTALKDLYNAAVRDYEKNPLALQQDFQVKSKNMFSALEELNAAGIDLTAKEFSSYLNFVEALLDDPSGRMGQQKIANYAASKTAYDAFDIGDELDDYKVNNKDLDSPEALAAAAADLRARILSGAFTAQDTQKAQENLNNLRRALGTRIIKRPDSDWFSTSGDEWVQKKLQKLSQSPGNMDFPVEDIAGMYENMMRKTAERNINLADSYRDNKKILEPIFDEVRKEFVAAKYGVPVGVVDAAIYNGRIMELSQEPTAPKEAYYKELSTAVERYKAGSWNGQRARIKKDGNEVIDIFFEDER